MKTLAFVLLMTSSMAMETGIQYEVEYADSTTIKDLWHLKEEAVKTNNKDLATRILEFIAYGKLQGSLTQEEIKGFGKKKDQFLNAKSIDSNNKITIKDKPFVENIVKDLSEKLNATLPKIDKKPFLNNENIVLKILPNPYVTDVDTWKTVITLLSNWHTDYLFRQQELLGSCTQMIANQDDLKKFNILKGEHSNDLDMLWNAMISILPIDQQNFVPEQFQRTTMFQNNVLHSGVISNLAQANVGSEEKWFAKLDPSLVTFTHKIPNETWETPSWDTNGYCNDPNKFIFDITKDFTVHSFKSSATKRMAGSVILHFCAYEIGKPFSRENIRKNFKIYLDGAYKTVVKGIGGNDTYVDSKKENIITFQDPDWKTTIQKNVSKFQFDTNELKTLIGNFEKEYGSRLGQSYGSPLLWFDSNDHPDVRIKNNNWDMDKTADQFTKSNHALYENLAYAYTLAKENTILDDFFNNAFPHESHCTAQLAAATASWIQNRPFLTDPDFDLTKILENRITNFAQKDNEFLGGVVHQFVQDYFYKPITDVWIQEGLIEEDGRYKKDTYIQYLQYYKGSVSDLANKNQLPDAYTFATDLTPLFKEAFKKEATVRYNKYGYGERVFDLNFNEGSSIESEIAIISDIEQSDRLKGKWLKYSTTDSDLVVAFCIPQAKVKTYDSKGNLNETDILDIRIFKKAGELGYMRIFEYLREAYQKEINSF